jgi:hypothetical protein
MIGMIVPPRVEPRVDTEVHMTGWRLWLRLDLGLEEDAFLGAIGPHACATLGSLMGYLALADTPTIGTAPPRRPAPTVVVVDAPVLARDPRVAGRLPEGAACVLVAPSACPDVEIDAACTALGARPPWTMLCESAIEGWFGRKGLYREVLMPTTDCAPILALGLFHPDVLARAGAQHRDALLTGSTVMGEDDRAKITGYTLAQALRRPRPARLRHWRRAHTRQILDLSGPLLPGFRALLGAALRSPGGRRLDVEILVYDDQEPLPSGKTWWTAYQLEWQVRRG